MDEEIMRIIQNIQGKLDCIKQSSINFRYASEQDKAIVRENLYKTDDLLAYTKVIVEEWGD